MTHFELSVQISAFKSKYYPRFSRFGVHFLDHFKIIWEFSKQFFLTAIEAQTSKLTPSNLKCPEKKIEKNFMLAFSFPSKFLKPTKHFQSKFSRFSHLLECFCVSARNFVIFLWNTSNSMASTFLGLDRCERKLLGKFPSFFEMIQKIKC